MLCVCRGVGKGSDDPPWGEGGANFIHFLYKVLGNRSVQLEPLCKTPFKFIFIITKRGWLKKKRESLSFVNYICKIIGDFINGGCKRLRHCE